MGFFYSSREKKKTVSSTKSRGKIDQNTEAILYKKGCSACPLNDAVLTSPKMEATGNKNPLIYVLGEAPGREEDRAGAQFVGAAGRTLRSCMEDAVEKAGSNVMRLASKLGDGDITEVIRFNNTIRCRPGQDNRDPTSVELACCRGYIEDDIAKTKPRVIIGTGAIPLQWVGGSLRKASISFWRGRYIPVDIKGHRCWYYCVWHPSYVMRSEEHIGDIFVKDLERVFSFVGSKRSRKPPVIYTEQKLKKGVEHLHNADEIVSALSYFKKCEQVAVDIETTASKEGGYDDDIVFKPQAPESSILSISISDGDRTIAFCVDHPRYPYEMEDRNRIVRALVAKVLNNEKVIKIFHNLCFDLTWLTTKLGVRYNNNRYGDTMAMAYAVDERRKLLNLDALCFLHLGIYLKPLTDVDVSRLVDVPIDDLLMYNSLDTKATSILAKKLGRILKREGLYNLYETLLVEGAVTASAMTNKGVPISLKNLRLLEKQLQKDFDKISKRIRGRAAVKKFRKKMRRELNPNSPNPDLKILFADILNRREVLTESGSVTTKESVLKNMTDCPVAKDIIMLRNVQKNLRTYVTGSMKLVFPDNRFHPNINPFVTSTGRLSSDTPNTQNFPKRKDKYIRKQVYATEGHSFLAADYGQIEARALAMASEDERFCESLWKGQDIHYYWSEVLLELYSGIWDRIIEDYSLEDAEDKKIMKTLRDEMKNGWVFPLFYGSSSYSCALALQIPDHVADEMYKEFWAQHEGVKKWQEYVKQFYREHGYVETLTGRRRHGPIDHGQLINSPIQGTASDIVVDAGNRLRQSDDYYMIPNMNIHDDLTFELPNDRYEDYAKEIAVQMTSCPFDFAQIVPLVVELERGRRWDKMRGYADYHSVTGFEEKEGV